MIEHELRECPVHGMVKFSKHDNGSAKPSMRCSKCQSDRVQKVVEAKRQKAYDVFGRACAVCGYDKCEAALEWHHLDPTQKEVSPAKVFSRSWENIEKELRKCVLLCANCHREVHHGVTIL